MASVSSHDGDVTLSSIWPGEPPADQLALWASMSQRHRNLAAKRLEAILAYEAGGSRNAAAYVDEDELSLPRFHAILAAWRRDPSLISLVPQVRRRSPRAFVPPAGIEAAAAAAVRANRDRVLEAERTGPGSSVEAVRADRGSSLEAMALELRERFGGPSLSWIRRLVTKATGDLERELAGGTEGFARRIVLDSAALPLPLFPLDYDRKASADDDDEGIQFEWAVAALAWDAATGYILGHALDRAPADLVLHARAATTAAAHLRRIAASGDFEAKPEIMTTLPLEGRNGMENLRMVRMLEADGAGVLHSPRAAGSELMKAFQGRIGRLDLRPRFAADYFVGRSSREAALAKSGRSPMDLGEARLVIEHEVSAHNITVTAEDLTPSADPTLAADGLDRVFRRFLAN